ncbi:hypothetical protein AB0C51_17850 [Streptomyces pathocidini]|uniref:hypothetical protein n=1 Tax=Streptomyces pathocidini TaxID=1650571 RepID=UPI00340FB2C9
MHEPADAPPPAPHENHHTRTTDQGRFSIARCNCGWTGPARRARSKAREDANAHTQARNPT